MSRKMQTLIASPIVILIASAVRLLVISNQDSSVASTIASSRGVVGSLLGTVVPLLPPYLPLLALLLVLYRNILLTVAVAVAAVLVSPAYDSAINGWRYVISSLPRLSTLVWHQEWETLYREAPRVSACAAVGLFFAFWGVGEVSRQRGGADFLTIVRGIRYIALGVVYGVICTAGLLFTQAVYNVPFDIDSMSQVLRRPWLPAEEITTNDGAVHVGYVISTSDGWFLILNEQDRSLDYVVAGSVTARKTCTPQEYRTEYRPPLIELRGGRQPNNRPCGAPTGARAPVQQANPGTGP
jgi:hypothetical protein